MDTSSFWIAIVSMILTTVASSVGFYFTYKAQRAPLREQLYSKQIDVLLEFSVLSTRLQKIAFLLLNEIENPDEQKSIDEFWDETSLALLDVTQRGAITMPSSLYSAMTAVRVRADEFEEAIVKKQNIQDAYHNLMGACSNVAMLGRAFIGADTLAIESLHLHNPDGYSRMENVGVEAMVTINKALWNQSHDASK